MKKGIIDIYTDGSCHTQLKVGAWAAILLLDDGSKVVLKDRVQETTHNRMELMAVIKAIDYIKSQSIVFESLRVFSDSQYVVQLEQRKEKLKKQGFQTKSGKAIRNVDLVQLLIQYLDTENIQLNKVKAHQKKTETINYNRQVDKLVRKLMRE